MRNKFREFYTSKEDIKDIGEKGIFTFDTNVLLNLYEYEKETSDKFLNLFEKIKEKEQIWIPNQVGLEFHSGRMKKLLELDHSYKEIKEIIKYPKKELKEKYPNGHLFFNLKEIIKELNDFEGRMCKKIDEYKKEKPNYFEKDDILEKLTKIFADNIGEGYNNERLAEVYKEGEMRYSLKIPPGYEDDFKKDKSKYGDLILWYQMIDKAKESKKPIIFTTEDQKEDWWYKEKGSKKAIPRYELKREMWNEANVDFHIYSSKEFLEYASKKYSNKEIENDILVDVGKVSLGFATYANIGLRIEKYAKSQENMRKTMEAIRELASNYTFNKR